MIRAYIRDIRLLIRQFRLTLLVFALLLLSGTITLRYTYRSGYSLDWLEAIDMTLSLMFFKLGWDFPGALPAQLVYILWPVLSLALVVNSIQVVLRMFDQQPADDIRQSFGFAAFSTSALAAPALAAAATRAAVEYTLFLNDVLPQYQPPDGDPWIRVGRQTGGGNRTDPAPFVVLHSTSEGGMDFHPSADRPLAVGDCIAVLASLDGLSAL